MRLSTAHPTSAIRSLTLTDQGTGVLFVRTPIPSTYPDVWVVAADGSTLHMHGEGVEPAARLFFDWDGYSLRLDLGAQMATLLFPDGTSRAEPLPAVNASRQALTEDEAEDVDDYLVDQIKSIGAAEKLHALYEPLRKIIFETGEAFDRARDSLRKKLDELRESAKKARRDLYADEPIGDPADVAPNEQKAKDVVEEFQALVDEKTPTKRQLPKRVSRRDEERKLQKTDYRKGADRCVNSDGEIETPCGEICCAPGSVCASDASGTKACAKTCFNSVDCPTEASCCERQPTGPGRCKPPGDSSQQCICNAAADCPSGRCGLLSGPGATSFSDTVCVPVDGAPGHGCGDGVSCTTADYCCGSFFIEASPAGLICLQGCSSDADCGPGRTCSANISGACNGRRGSCN